MSITDTAQPEAPLSVDQLTALFDEEDKADAAGEAPKEEEAPEAEAQAEEPEAELEAEADDDLEAVEEEEEPEVTEPIPDPPQSWSKEDREGWEALTPKARETVLRREADRDKAVAKAVQQASETLKFVQELAEKTESLAHLATDAMTQKWGANHNKIDWAGIARTRPAEEYLALKAEYDTDIAELSEAARVAGEQRSLARNAFVAEQSKKLAEIEPELMDPEKGAERRGKVYAWLEGEGFPREVLTELSAIELRAAYKAMRFDEMQAKAKAQAALPRKNPTTTAKPLPKSGGGGAAASLQRPVQAASQRLSKTGKVDDLVALFDAEDAAKARKAGR